MEQKPTVTCLIIGGILICLNFSSQLLSLKQLIDKIKEEKDVCNTLSLTKWRWQLILFLVKIQVEEYDMKSHELLLRKVKKQSNIKESKWEYEIGEAPLNPSQQEQLLKAANANPIFLRKDTERDFQFRIRNLSYPEDVYQVEVDEEKQQIVIRTTNKKYFKRIDVPDMARSHQKLEKDKASFVYKNNTLLVSYPKPDPILQRESERRKQFEKLNAKKPREGDIEFVEN